jgi:NADPH2:quinone reductase
MASAAASWAIRYATTGGPEVMKLCRYPVADVKLGPTQLLVRNAYAGVNFIDLYFRRGVYPVPPQKQGHTIPGTEGVGVIMAAGNEVTDPALQVGKRVAFFGAWEGAYTTHCVHNASDLFPVPEGVDDRTAAGAMLQGLTAHYLTHSCFVAAPGKWVLVPACAGGTGLLISQMCKLRGATVVGTCGGADKVELAKSVGRADFVIDRSATPDWAAAARALRPEGFDAIIDGVGKATFEAGAMTLLRRRGSMITFGNASGVVPPISPLDLTNAGSVTLQRPSLMHFVERGGEVEGRMKDLFGWIASGSLKVTVSHEFPLEKAAEAQELLGSGKSVGKIIIKCDVTPGAEAEAQ